jgi:predicted RNase H-like nuclease
VSLRRGPELPYKLVAGVVPWGRRWVAAGAKMAGTTFAPEEPKLYSSFIEILDERPSYSILVVAAPIGYREEPDSPARTCEQLARKLLGRRYVAIRNAPSRRLLAGEVSWRDDHVDGATGVLLPAIREFAAEMSPYRQRTVYEGNPELSFYQLNGDQPLTTGKLSDIGHEERRRVLEAKIPGVAKALDADVGVPLKHLLDAGALLWTARRVLGHAARRLPTEGEWDSEGLRMEIVY